MMKKKLLTKVSVIIAAIAVVVTTLIVSLVNTNDEIPNYMKTPPRTERDKEIATTLLEELEAKYNTNFTLLGVAYSEFLTEDGNNKVDEVSAIYAYSDEYPKVYVSNHIEGGTYFDFDRPHFDRYLEEVEKYKFEQEIYQIAEKSAIDASLLAVDVWLKVEEDTNQEHIDALANKTLNLNELKKLFQTVLNDTDTDEIEVRAYITEKGNRKQFEEYIRNFVGINDHYLKTYFGDYQKVEFVVTKQGVKEK